MQRIWNSIVKPLVNKIPVSTVLEIGAKGGGGTRALARYVDQRDAVLHCIDPLPTFDPEQVQARYPGRLVFHRALSLSVISQLPSFDVGLIDGDHNWYTVFNELRQIEALHDRNETAFPLLFLHDVGWPYGRRDLYYDPGTIPEEFRQLYAQDGILLNKSRLDPERGLNRGHFNAIQSGGPRNGVLTGIEDYVKQSSLEFQLVVLPINFGLAILVTKDRLDTSSRLTNALAALQSTEGWARLCELGEELRCADIMVLQTLKGQLDSQNN